jgi:protein arginine kinase activator
MQCSCQKPKIYHVTDVIDNVGAETLSLCEDCMKKFAENGVIDLQQPESKEITQEEVIKDILKAFQMLIGKPVEVQKVDKPACVKCGITLEEIFKKGRLGCPHCYEHFGEEIAHFLVPMQGGAAKHVGKVPKNLKNEVPSVPIDLKIKMFEDAMKDAVANEKYEEAAKLRDGIKTLTNLNQEFDLLKIEFENKILTGGDSESVKSKMNEIMGKAIALEESILNKP